MFKYSVLSWNPVDYAFVSCGQVGFGAGQPVDLSAGNSVNSLAHLLALFSSAFVRAKFPSNQKGCADFIKSFVLNCENDH